jgi:hypothetical protein
MVIYEIKIQDYRYIGSTKNKRTRYNSHINNLKKNKHYNKFMQNVYNKHNNLDFTILETCADVNSMKILEEEYIKEYKNKYGDLCMNILSKYGGGSEWRKYKTPDELEKIDHNRLHLSPETQQKRNKTHSETVKSISFEIRKEWYDRANKTRADNIKNRKNYKPIHIKITFPNENSHCEHYDSESLFFKGTGLEDTSLRELKNTGKKLIKKRLHWTKHKFPVGTLIEIIDN